MYNPVGVFDSGYGGLTILRDIVKQLPEYDYIYFAKLQQLRDVAGDYGIDLQGNTLHIASAVVAAPGTMKLTWDGGAAEVALPALKPGEVFKYILPAGAKNISGIMPGGAAFDITPLRTEQLK